MPNRLELSQSQIIAALRARGRVLRSKDLLQVLNEHREEWKIPRSVGYQKFLRFLMEQVRLRRIDLPLPHRRETLFVLDDVPVLAIALAAKPGGYLTHFTAMGLHELTTQVSKTVYVNVEQRPQPSNPGSLTQESIDRAFRNQQRKTTNVAEHAGLRLMYVNGKHTGRLGVEQRRLDSGDVVEATNLARTLIDIAVRPAYSGGVPEVMQAYRAAVERVSGEEIAEMLSAMRFVYPYEQAVGYYMERAGAPSGSVAMFRRKRFEFDFYLAHGMRETVHVPEWRLFAPKGL